MDFKDSYLNARLWQGIASVYGLFALVALFGVIALLEGEIVPGIAILAITALISIIAHRLIKHYLKGRDY